MVARLRGPEAQLLATSALLLFVELLLIRWVPANVVYFGFFANLILMASFLGMGVGILVGRANGKGRSRIPFPPFALLLLIVVSLVGSVQLSVQLRDPHQIFFGVTENSRSDIGFVVIPVVVALVTMLMASLAQPLGRLLTAMPPLRAYGVDILGSLLGIGSFAILSALSTPPPVWFVVVAVLLAFRAANSRIDRWSIVTAAAMVAVIGVSVVSMKPGEIWSPYYRIDLQTYPDLVEIDVNGIPHQVMTTVPRATREPMYYQVYKWLPGRTFDRVLIVGAGNGTDVAIALEHGAKSVDAVEIDPQIQAIGVRGNGDGAYSDARVSRFVNDGRAFLRNATQRYDLVVFALPDSLTLVGSTANIRLESFLFTREAFASVRDHLAPDGVFVLYNYYRQGWLVDKIALMAEEVFGRAPLIQTYPSLGLSGAAIADGPGTVTGAARTQSPASTGVGPPPGDPPSAIGAESSPTPATDDWPFLYLFQPSMPPTYLLTLALILAWAVAITTRAARISQTPLRRFSPHFFFLGAAFMLLETRSLVTFSLLFGTTWLVNALVFAGVLVSVLAAIAVNARLKPRNQAPLYAALFAAIVVAYVLRPEALLIDPPWVRYVLASVIAFAPVFLANLVFTFSFRETRTADMAFASNLLGALVGGVLEYVSLLTGYRALLILVAVLYVAAYVSARRLRVLGDADLVAVPGGSATT